MTARSGVFHVFATFERGGAETRTLEALGALSPLKQRHTVAALANGSGPLRRSFEVAGARTRVLPFKSLVGVVGLWKELRRARVLHNHLGTVGAPVMVMAWIARVPVRVAHFRSDSTIDTSSLRGRVVRRVANNAVRVTATDVIGVSPSALANGYRPDWESDSRNRVMYSGVRCIGTDPSAAPRVREMLEVSGQEKVVLHIGRDIPDKNRSQALAILGGQALEGVHLVFVGRDDEATREAMVGLAAERGLAGRVHWLGQRSDIPHLLQGADALLMTSRREGMPGVVLEALSAGVPVLASNVPGAQVIATAFPESVTTLDLSAGPERWQAALRATLDSTGGDLAREARANRVLESEFSLVRCVAQFDALWSS